VELETGRQECLPHIGKEGGHFVRLFSFSGGKALLVFAFGGDRLAPETFMPNQKLKSRRWWWAAAGAVLLAEGFVFLRSFPEKKRWAAEPVLTLNLEEGTESEGYRFHEQPERLDGAVEQLSFATGRCGVFSPLQAAGQTLRSLDFFYFEYDPGNSRFIHDVFGHAPEVCLRATGATLKKEHPSRTIGIEGRSLKVLVLEFVSPVSSGPLWVFRFTWLPENVPYDPYEPAYTMRGQKALIGILGSPKPPARVLLAGAMGYENLDAAWESYERLLVSRLKLIKP